MAMLFITHDLGIVGARSPTTSRDAARARSSKPGRWRTSSPIRSIPIRERCSPPSRKGEPPPRDARAPTIVERGEPAGLVSDQARLSSPHGRSREGGRRRFARRARGRDGRRRRRIGLRQDDARARDVAADPLGRRRSPIAGGAIEGLERRRRCGRCGARCRSSSRTRSARCRRACRSPRSSRRA